MWIHFSLSIYRRRDEVVKTDEFFSQDTRLSYNLGPQCFSANIHIRVLFQKGKYLLYPCIKQRGQVLKCDVFSQNISGFGL